MFTGIVQDKYPLEAVEHSGDYGRLGIRIPPELRESLKLGGSVAIDGVCLTVCQLSTESVMMDVIKSNEIRALPPKRVHES